MFLSRSQITRESFGSPPPDHVALQGRAFVRYPDTPDWILIENHSSFCARDPDEKEFGYPLCPHLFGGSAPQLLSHHGSHICAPIQMRCFVERAVSVLPLNIPKVNKVYPRSQIFHHFRQIVVRPHPKRTCAEG